MRSCRRRAIRTDLIHWLIRTSWRCRGRDNELIRNLRRDIGDLRDVVPDVGISVLSRDLHDVDGIEGLRVWTGGGGKRLVHEIFVSQAVFDDELSLPQRRRGVGVRLVGVGSALGSNMVDVTAT